MADTVLYCNYWDKFVEPSGHCPIYEDCENCPKSGWVDDD